MDNMELYNIFRAVPDNAKKDIAAGRLKGKTDINPMFRIKSLTERFGPCGIGWIAPITKQWTEVGAKGETAAFCNIELRYKQDGEWSEPIFGTGGSMFVAQEKNGLYTSDECYKMAYTDALSVACKLIGIGADVYWQQDATKYSRNEKALHGNEVSAPTDSIREHTKPSIICAICGATITKYRSKDGTILSSEQFAKKTQGICAACYKDVHSQDGMQE